MRRSITVRALVAGLFLLCAGTAGAGASAAPTDPSPGSSRAPACVPLTDGSLTINTRSGLDHGRQLGSARFRMPAGTVQGEPTWFRVRLNYRVTFLDDAPGTSYLSLSTNGFAAAQLKFEQTGHTVRWSSVSASEGHRRGTVRGHVLQQSFDNFLQRDGLRGGLNDVTVELSTYRSARLRSVELLPGSCLYRSSFGPQFVEVAARSGEQRLSPGHWTPIHLRITNQSPTAIEGVRVVLDGDGLAVRSGGTVNVPVLRDSTVVTFQVKPEVTGDVRADVQVGSSAFPSLATATVLLRSARDGGFHLPWTVGVAGLLLLVAAACFVAARRSGSRTVRRR